MGAPIDRGDDGCTHAQWALFWWAPPSIGASPYPMLFDHVGVVMGCGHPIDRGEPLPYVILPFQGFDAPNGGVNALKGQYNGDQGLGPG